VDKEPHAGTVFLIQIKMGRQEAALAAGGRKALRLSVPARVPEGPGRPAGAFLFFIGDVRSSSAMPGLARGILRFSS
jgi:hypothetical protein